MTVSFDHLCALALHRSLMHLLVTSVIYFSAASRVNSEFFSLTSPVTKPLSLLSFVSLYAYVVVEAFQDYQSCSQLLTHSACAPSSFSFALSFVVTLVSGCL